MIEGSQYELQCDVQNVAPVHLLTVNWYKGQHLVKSVESDHHSSITPVNYSNTLWISTSKDDDGVQYRCEAELKLGPEGPQPPPVVTSDPLNITVHCDCPIKLQPVKLAVEFGASASANCSTTINHHGMGWEASEGAVDMVDDVQFITWRVESLTHWDIEPICYINTNKQCELTLQVTVYKRPDRVSISTVGHTGPMIEGSQYELQCDVQNVAPVHLLTVNWYKGQHLVKSVESDHHSSITPVNYSNTLWISTSKDDDGVQYRCEAELKLGPEGPQPPPVVTSDPLNITVHCDCPIKLQPVKLAVEFGASASANCSTTINHHGMGWEASEGAVDMVDDVQFITWRVESLTHWDIKPFCYINANEQCELTLQVTVYKPPDRVSISTVGHTGPMTEGSQYELECDVQNVAPVHLLTVNW
ncbi:uncharacterized protein LOC128317287 [Pangasianodon hypophthalmus]|uniref:uncharacterized protein LOC128317287 n=1 Tax=Pangasianodon hypophthalmus TaxID=310915 RepID=UPI002306FC46|nr:uncharacterized protein LOC128317287 [Pangasianodon hypophthalmus]